jgi:ADP-ribose pyrophosphatase YjhB (NUDIX family)
MRHKHPVAVHLFLLRDDEVLLLRRFNTGYEDGNYSVIAGHVDGNETFVDAMIREAKEEANIILLDLEPIQVMHRKSEDERIDYFFVAKKWEGLLKNNEPNKCDALDWFPLESLPSNMVPYVDYALKSYLSKKTFTSYGWEEL